MNETRLGRFNKDGYKKSFSKGELAKELVLTNKDNQQLKDNSNKLEEWLNEEKSKASTKTDIYSNFILHKEVLEKMQEIINEEK